jgi:hypothetical protein
VWSGTTPSGIVYGTDEGMSVAFQALRIEALTGSVEWEPRPESEKQVTASNSQGTHEVFVPLFNGKDLSGWTARPNHLENWHVKDGILVGSGGRATASVLYTQRGDYKDFHLRAEVRITGNEFGGLWIRAQIPSDLSRGLHRDFRPHEGYRIDLRDQMKPPPAKSAQPGGIWVIHPGTAPGIDTYWGHSNYKTFVGRGDWFTLDVIAERNHIIVLVNGHTTADSRSSNNGEERDYRSGHIALNRMFEEPAVGTPKLEFRKIEIAELGAQAPAVVANPQPDSGALNAPFDESAAKKAQQEWAERLKTPVQLTNSIGMPLRLIPPGQFQMGFDEGSDNAKPAHVVRITRPFYLGAWEVTRGQFSKFVTATHFKTGAERDKGGSRLDPEKRVVRDEKHRYTWRHPGFVQEDSHPVVDVTWEDANQVLRMALAHGRKDLPSPDRS